MAAVSRLCKRGILIENGLVTQDAPIHDVVSNYMTGGTGTSAEIEWADLDKAPGGEIARLRSARIMNTQGISTDVIDIRKKVGIQMKFDVIKSGHIILPHFFIHNDEGVLAFATLDQDPEWRSKSRPEGQFTEYCVDSRQLSL